MRLLAAGFLVAVAACASAAEAPVEEDGGPELAATTLALHEVSVLYPLPKTGDVGLIPASRDLAGGRPLLPASIVDKLGDIVAGDPNSVTYALLRVVAFRIEPCFRASPDAPACERQLRFVFQPVSVDPSGRYETTTLDGAVHVIYELARDTFASLVSGIVAARPGVARASAPLGVNPILASEGLTGPYARAIEAQILTAASKGRITRVTFLGTRGRGNEWQLGGLSVARDGATSTLPIPSSGARLQSIVVQRGPEASGFETFAKSISPATAGPDDVALLLDSEAAEAAPREAVARALQAANRIENPLIRSSEDTDCATCHTIASSRLWVEAKLGLRDDRDRFTSPAFDLSSTSRPLADAAALRALGYFGTEPIVSPRAINDTAKAARWIGADTTERLRGAMPSK